MDKNKKNGMKKMQALTKKIAKEFYQDEKDYLIAPLQGLGTDPMTREALGPMDIEISENNQSLHDSKERIRRVFYSPKEANEAFESIIGAVVKGFEGKESDKNGVYP